MRIAALTVGGLMLLAAGCSRLPSIPNPMSAFDSSSVLHVEVAPSAASLPLLRDGQPVSLAVSEFADARAGKPGRKVGDIKATVTNMHGTEMTLDQDVTTFLSAAARSQLTADGFRLAGAAEPAEFRLAGTIKEFSLNIAGRDERTIAVEATLREGSSGDVIWSGVINEKDDRYAGVTGNSRATIVEYLGEGVSRFAGKLSAAVRDSLTRAYPKTLEVGRTKSVSAIPGVTTLREPVAREPAAAQRQETAAPPLPAVAAQIGHFSVQTVPSRAKVYVNDVYYGMSPLKFEMPVGVGVFIFKLDGYKTVTEKVSVRRGETTELEVKFEK